jgi:GTP pyrophosphokinase
MMETTVIPTATQPTERAAVSTDVTPHDAHTLGDVLAQVSTEWADPQTELIEHAYALAEAGHRGQTRKSGEPYISHPIEVAYLVAEIGLDPNAVAAALCHDLIEDCGVELSTVSDALGAEVAMLVDGLTKVDRLKFSSTEAARAATLRKLLVAVAKDVRVLIIKLADRLHNMRTLAPLDPPKARRIAEETLEVYVPLAHRLGMSQVQTELEDLAFAVCYPDRYAEIDRQLAASAPARDSELAIVVDMLTAALDEAEVPVDHVASRAKGHWSIYSKMIEQHKSFETITDLLGVRVIVNSVQDCYGALGVIHGLWAPVAGRLKDYVATPTYSLYQALHTTVIGPGGRPVEIQLRTVEMNERAERGIAAHWGYKGAGRRRNNEKEPAWLARVLDWDKESSGPEEFMSGLRAELDADEEVVVFTPRGDLVALPAGSGPLDFAYSIHTEVGHSCVGAKVNGRIVPLAHRLVSGDTVEVMTSRSGSSGPKEAWLRMAVTAKARGRIRQALAAKRRGTDVESGRGLLRRALRGTGLESKADDFTLMSNVAQTLGYQGSEALFTALGTRHLKAQVVVARLRYYLSPSTADQDTRPSSDPPGTKTLSALEGRGRKFLANDPQIIVEGMNGMLVRLANCCSPMPGQPIVGFVTSGRGVSVHTTDCQSLARLSGDRQVEVSWWDNAGLSQTEILIEALDRPGLLVDVVRALSSVGLDIAGSNTTVGDDRVARQRYSVICSGTEQLDVGLDAASQVPGVFSATRPTATGSTK